MTKGALKPSIYSLVAACVAVGICAPDASAAIAQGASGDMASRASKKSDSSLIKSHYDLTIFHFIPQHVRIIEQPDRSRILFQTKDHVPAGYAERKGEAIIYYDGHGKAIRVQRLTFDELARVERN